LKTEEDSFFFFSKFEMNSKKSFTKSDSLSAYSGGKSLNPALNLNTDSLSQIRGLMWSLPKDLQGSQGAKAKCRTPREQT
jgi:hypothetical protein